MKYFKVVLILFIKIFCGKWWIYRNYNFWKTFLIGTWNVYIKFDTYNWDFWEIKIWPSIFFSSFDSKKIDFKKNKYMKLKTLNVLQWFGYHSERMEFHVSLFPEYHTFFSDIVKKKQKLVFNFSSLWKDFIHKKDIQLWQMNVILILSKPYANKLFLKEQKWHLKYCQPLEFWYISLKGLDLLILEVKSL